MPQKGQITRHEWVGTRIISVCDCIHCDSTKVTYADGTVRYRSDKTGNYVKKIPKCITRKKPEDVSRSEEA